MTRFEHVVTTYGERIQKDLNITVDQAAGIFGNLAVETGGFTLLQEKRPLVKGSRGGYGWMQWTGPRRNRYEAWAHANKYDLSADETNYKYLIKETTTDEKASLAALRRTKTAETAAESFCKNNLRPGIPHMEKRKEWAKKAHDLLLKKTVPVVADTPVAIPGKAAATGTLVATGGVAAATQAPTEWVPAILFGAVLFGVLAWIAVRLYDRKEDQKVEEVKEDKDVG